ncbi:MAG: hypothetical protein WBE34_11585 [Candidatus Nitrosopolaris sp.]
MDEFTGRGTLADRQQRLNIMLHKLIRLAEVYNIAIVVTNQVQSQPDNFLGGSGDALRATGYKSISALNCSYHFSSQKEHSTYSFLSYVCIYPSLIISR